MKRKWVVGLFFLLQLSCVSLPSVQDADIRVLPLSKVNWEKLNPARGEKSPKAGTLWGDRKGTVATGFLVQFVDGFSSPPHIHNVSYKGLVLSGQVHNDDPGAQALWMPEGAFWTQPKGEAHITSAQGQFNMAYIEIEEGPYLVRPVASAFDSGERPINIIPSNLVWVSKGAGMVAYLWGETSEGALRGVLLKTPAGKNFRVITERPGMTIVVVKGQPALKQNPTGKLDPGSSVIVESKGALSVIGDSQNEVQLYIRSKGDLQVEALP